MQDEILLFAYGSLMRGELHAPLLIDATRLGPARTSPHYCLVELEQFPALVRTRGLSVEGELYAINKEILLKTDAAKDHMRVFHRQTIELDSGQKAEAYLMHESQVGGRRRLASTSWQARFQKQSFSSARRDPLSGLKRRS